jgi:hypothetical protein
MAIPTKKIPQWKLDMLKDTAVAAELIIKKSEADKLAEETAARLAAEKAANDTVCANFHAWKAINKYTMERVQVAAGVPSKTERGWEVEPKFRTMQVPNRQKCLVCDKA